MANEKIVEKHQFSDTMIIGNKPEAVFDAKTNQMIPTEPYLRPILSRLSHFGYVKIKVIPHPDKLAKVSQLYEILKWFGIREIYGSRKFIYEEQWLKTPNQNPEKVKIMLIRWDMIDRLKKYKDELLSEIKNED